MAPAFATKLLSPWDNIDLTRTTLPRSYRFVKGQRLGPLCRKHHIKFVPAVTDFVGSQRSGYWPVMGGVVVSRASEPKLLALIAERDCPENVAKREANRQKRIEAEQRRVARAFDSWSSNLVEFAPDDLIRRAWALTHQSPPTFFSFETIRLAIISYLELGQVDLFGRPDYMKRMEERIVALYPWLDNQEEMELHFHEANRTWEQRREEKRRQQDECRKQAFARLDTVQPGEEFAEVSGPGAAAFRHFAKQHLRKTRGFTLYHEGERYYVLPDNLTVAGLWAALSRDEPVAAAMLHDHLMEAGIPVPEVVKKYLPQAA